MQIILTYEETLQICKFVHDDLLHSGLTQMRLAKEHVTILGYEDYDYRILGETSVLERYLDKCSICFENKWLNSYGKIRLSDYSIVLYTHSY